MSSCPSVLYYENKSLQFLSLIFYIFHENNKPTNFRLLECWQGSQYVEESTGVFYVNNLGQYPSNPLSLDLLTFLPNFDFEKSGGPVTNGKILSWMIYGRTFFVCNYRYINIKLKEN